MGCTVEALYRAAGRDLVVREQRVYWRGRLAAESHMAFAVG